MTKKCRINTRYLRYLVRGISWLGFIRWISSKFEIKSIPSQIGFAQDQARFVLIGDAGEIRRIFILFLLERESGEISTKLFRNIRIAHVWIHRVRRISIDRISWESGSFQGATPAIIKLLGLLILSSTVYTE